MIRRLLTAAETADKIGMPRSEFYRTRDQLVRLEGFPPPTIGRGPHQRAKYDNIAIDRWLEMKLPAHLRAVPHEPPVEHTSIPLPLRVGRDWETELLSRLSQENDHHEQCKIAG